MQKSTQKSQMISAFMNLCATIIQANFRGYQKRKYYKKFLPVYRRFKQLLYAGFMGWKTRKVLKLSIIKNKVNQMNLMRASNKLVQVRIAKRDLSDQISRLLKGGQWLYYYFKEKRVPLADNKISIARNQSNNFKKTNLKQAFNLIPKLSNNISARSSEQNNKKITQKSKQTADNYQKRIRQPNKSQRNTQIQTRNRQFQKESVSRPKQRPKQQRKFQLAKNPKKVQNQKNVALQVQSQDLQDNLSKTMQCQTPHSVVNVNSNFSFQTKGRNQTQEQNKKQSKQQIQIHFKKIQVFTHSSKKGLNMTLSKKSNNQKPKQLSSINLDVLNQFTKLKSTINVQQKNQVSMFNAHQESKTQGKALLQIKKDEFQKRKLQYEKKSQRFKQSS